MSEISEKVTEALREAQEFILQGWADEHDEETRRVYSLVTKALEAAALVRAEANAGEPVVWQIWSERFGKWVFDLPVIIDPDAPVDAPRRPLFAAAPQPSGPVGALDWSTFNGPVRNTSWAPDLQELIYTALNYLDGEGDADEDAGEQIIERLLAALSALTADKPEQAVPSGWREITEEDRPPNDTDVLMGYWETWPREGWHVECGHYGSTRGGWIHGRVTHWLPLDVLPAAPTAGGGDA